MKAEVELLFVIGPIGDQDSSERKRIDALSEDVIGPVAKRLGLRLDVAHKIAVPGSIQSQIFRNLLVSRIVVCDLTDLRPNVLYELGICHALGLRVVCIARRGTQLPFDISTERVIFYTDDLAGAQPLREAIYESAVEVLNLKHVKNSVQVALLEVEFEKNNISGKEDNYVEKSFEMILSQLTAIQKAVGSLSAPNSVGAEFVWSGDEEFCTTISIRASDIDTDRFLTEVWAAQRGVVRIRKVSRGASISSDLVCLIYSATTLEKKYVLETAEACGVIVNSYEVDVRIG